MNNPRTVIIFGAGASKATHDLPVDANFLSTYAGEVRNDFFLQLALDKIFGASNWISEGLENAWTEIDDNYNQPKVVLTTMEIKDVLREFEKRAEVEESRPFPRYYWTYFHRDRRSRTPYNYLFLFAGWELRKLMLKFLNVSLRPERVQPYRHLFERVRQEDESFSTVSLNYDRLAEQALEAYHYYPFQEGTGHEVLKPHGSLNWKHVIPTGRPDSIEVIGALSVEDLGYDEDGSLIQHSIIGLVRTKREFGPSEESSAIRYYYPRILDRSVTLLTAAESIYIIGYSFPLGDTHLRIILHNLRQRRTEPYKMIIYVVKDNDNNKQLHKTKVGRLFDTPEHKIEVLTEGFENVGW